MTKTLNSKILVDRENFQEILINAVRYTLPRKFYITSLMSELLRKYMKYVDRRTLYQIRVDILEQKLKYSLDLGWNIGFKQSINVAVKECFKKRFGLTDIKQASYCRRCNSATKTDMDDNGQRYCARCGVIKHG